jgi:O-6-methylguanine DNA methyltransferase
MGKGQLRGRGVVVNLQTHLGRVTVVWEEGRLCRIDLGRLERSAVPGAPSVVAGEAPHGAGDRLMGALSRYFAGEPVSLGCELCLERYSPFQQAVWQAAQEIPYGATRSYGWIAKRIGRPKAPRAAGGALKRNPFLLVVPCHRVVGSDGALTGFARGVRWKAALLELESGRLRNAVGAD